MRMLFALGFLVGLAAACELNDDVSPNDTRDASTGGTGGTSGECALDTNGSAGAVHIQPVSPRAGSWCPRDGLEVCVDYTPGMLPSDPTLVTDAGEPVDPPPVLSRCVDEAWQAVPGASCEASYHECNIPARFTDGNCCTDLRNCQEAFCDGERWWTRR